MLAEKNIGSLIIFKKWTEYFENLLNSEEQTETFLWTYIIYIQQRHLLSTNTMKNLMIDYKYWNTINRLNWMRFRVTFISKTLNEETTASIHKRMEHILEGKIISQNWNSVFIYPEYKKGNLPDYNYCRSIALLKASYKILTYCIPDRIKIMEDILKYNQSGFRQNRSTTD